MERITCDRQMPGNLDCKNCGIKAREKDPYGTYHLSEGEAVQEGLTIIERSANAWTGLPSRRVAQCARGENGVTVIIDES